MADLKTDYLGYELSSPFVVSSNPLCRDAGNIRRLEDLGAGAVVLPSLFEEQITLQDHANSSELEESQLPPALKHLPDMKEYNQGVDGYLMHIYDVKTAVDMPVIASLNGTSMGGWVSYARLLESVGADAMELNIYYLPTAIESTGTEIEQRFVHLLREVKEEVSIPVAVKLNPYFSSIPNIASQLTSAGADGLVFFNRFFQPAFDIENQSVEPHLELTHPSELLLRLRWVSLLYGHIDTDMAITGGIYTERDAIKALMAGASVAMVASTLLKNGVEHMGVMKSGLGNWLDAHGYASVADIRGRMSGRNLAAPAALERANYIDDLHSYAYQEQ
jgi:dihydroorotate dehydrogenase (fumarate)